jgi:stage V sporulation protein G
MFAEGGERMQVTDVRVRKISAEGKMKAIVSVTFDDAFVVHDIKIIEGQNGLFIAMPSRRMADGEFRDIAHPINSDTRALIQKVVFDEYEKMLAEEGESGEGETSEV